MQRVGALNGPGLSSGDRICNSLRCGYDRTVEVGEVRVKVERRAKL
jgi:hypothetical protein